MIKEVEIDIFQAPINYLVHSCNCFHTMGGGIAKEIKNRFPEVYQADLKTARGSREKLGDYYCIKVSEKLSVVNLYGQYHYGHGARYTNYDALDKGLNNFRTMLNENYLALPTIGLPYKLGCNLGGGNWAIVRAIIEESFVNYNGDVLICKKV